MESTQELQHWGIKGQKWGIRRYQNEDGTLTEAGKKRYRYQNPDGSLTEEGKKDYMTAAKKGKLDLSKLSNQDLDMINARFAKENTYKQNIQRYEDSKFSNQLKKAVINRVKGNGKGKGKGGNSTIAKLFAMPIQKAFEDAFKNSGGNEKGKKEDTEGNKQAAKNKESDSLWRGFKEGKHFARFGYKESDELRESRINNGKRFIDDAIKFGAQTKRTSEDILRERQRERMRVNEIVDKNEKWWNSRRDDPDSWGWSGMRFDTSEYLMHGTSQYIITRSDELKHHGIKGQRWGVRRFENADGTLTPEGKERYRTYADKAKKEIGDASRDPRTSMGVNFAASKKRMFGDKDSKKYRELDKVVNKTSRKLGAKYGSKSTKENAKAFADAVASSGLQYITENFPESKQDEAKAFVYAMFVQMQDKAIRKEFGQINN